LNYIGEQGARYLAEALKENSTLQKIYLECNHIESQGAKWIVHVIEVNSALLTINLAENEIIDSDD
jgi:hypothetical protein